MTRRQRDLSPGTVLTALMMAGILDGDDAVHEVDFGRGDDPYKRLWAGRRRQRVGLVIADPRRPRGAAGDRAAGGGAGSAARQAMVGGAALGPSRRTMRILYSHRIGSRDGQGVHLEEMVAALRAQGHEVRVVGPSFYEQGGLGGESRAVGLARRLLPGWAAELAELAYNVPAYRAARPRRGRVPAGRDLRARQPLLPGRRLLARRHRCPTCWR